MVVQKEVDGGVKGAEAKLEKRPDVLEVLSIRPLENGWALYVHRSNKESVFVTREWGFKFDDLSELLKEVEKTLKETA